MNAIFGIMRRDGNSVAPSHLDTMRQAMAAWGPVACTVFQDGPVAMGKVLLSASLDENRGGISFSDPTGENVVTTAGRIDNRDALIADCGLRTSGMNDPKISDERLFCVAYRKWGEDCYARLFGDWALAAYDQKERKLSIARDHCGNTTLYYYADQRIFAYASLRNALLALDLAPKEMDELYLAQVLVSWPAYHGERTICKGIKRLPPSHSLTVSAERVDTRRYWRLEDTPELRLSKRTDYVEAFRSLFDEAVQCRLRTTGNIAVTLSGGLDSGSVTATAARFLQNEDRRLAAFTFTPLSDTGSYLLGNRFGDEYPFAQATARYAGNVDLHPVTAATSSPIQAIRRVLALSNEPSHGPGNLFWLLTLMESVRQHGCRTLLTGQKGNGGVSWPGDVFSQPLSFQLRHLGWRKWAREVVKHYAPAGLLKTYRKVRRPENGCWNSTAINPDFANRLRLSDRILSAPSSPLKWPRDPFEQRCRIIKPGRSLVGSIWFEVGAAYGLDVRDPTADARVLAFAFSVPDRIFIDPETGLDRWLIREAMKGRLADEVRLNRKRGRQSSDIVPRLRACANEVEAALNELAAGPAVGYVNVPYMRQVWSMVRTDNTPEAFNKSVTILTRGIMAGLWVNGFYNAS